MNSTLDELKRDDSLEVEMYDGSTLKAYNEGVNGKICFVFNEEDKCPFLNVNIDLDHNFAPDNRILMDAYNFQTNWAQDSYCQSMHNIHAYGKKEGYLYYRQGTTGHLLEVSITRCPIPYRVAS